MKVLVMLPLLLLTLGFLLGIARLYRTLIFFISWVVLCSVLYIGALMYGFVHADPATALMGAMAAALLTLPSIWFATLFSFATSSQVSPTPAQQVYGAYQALDNSQKKRVWGIARISLGLAAKHGATYLRKKGYRASADALGEAAKFM